MPTIDLAEFVTLEGIPVCETGIDYPASSGPVSLTRAMLSSAVEYANEDPHGLNPRIKIAHHDNPIDGDLQALFDVYNEGRDASAPSLGTIINLRTENDGHTLVGDWYGLPSWLAAILETAYPARSLEGGAWQNPANQKNYDFMIEAVALLGVVGPGCTSMADLQELFSSDGPKVTVIEMSQPKTGGSSTVPAVTMQVNVEDIRRAFYDQFAQGDRYWWWDRELLSDPWEFIASDENGDFWRIPFEADQDENGDTVVTSWGEPEAIKINYVPDPSRDGEGIAAVRLVAWQLPKAGKVLAVNNEPLRIKPQEEEARPAMGIDVKSVRKITGLSETDLPDDASEEQINEALAAHAADDEGETEETEVEAEGGEVENPSTPEIKAGKAVQVDPEAWSETQRYVKAAKERERKDVVEAAVQSGRIPPARKAHYLSLLEKDFKGTKEFLESLEANAVPLDERGHSEGAENLSSTRSSRGTGLFPELDARRNAREEANA